VRFKVPRTSKVQGTGIEGGVGRTTLEDVENAAIEEQAEDVLDIPVL